MSVPESVLYPVEDKKEIQDNIDTLEIHLQNPRDTKHDDAVGLVRRGKTFIVIKTKNGDYKFYPSKFIGYFNNSIDDHELYHAHRCGQFTNEVISEILGKRPKPNINLDSIYQNYCQNVLGYQPYKNKRKYWGIFLDNIL